MIVRGSTAVPGDKSLTHRALMLSAIARGESSIEGALTSLDARSTARVLRGVGVRISRLRSGERIQVKAPRALHAPNRGLDCGNSGTTARLGLGLLAAQPFSATLTGDRSLRRRPMRRVAEPLRAMGATIATPEGDGLPVRIQGGHLTPIRWELPVSSAQLKGAILLAALAGGVEASLREPAGRSRDHTERLLRGFGFSVTEAEDGWLHFEPNGALVPSAFRIPGDISSAAFLLGAAALADRGELRLTGVGVNPTRTAGLDVMARMGTAVVRDARQDWGGEPVADLIVGPGRLRATVVPAEEIPGLIDEIPLLAVLAARAEGTTVFHEVGELRVKESDRLSLLARNLTTLGVDARAEENTLTVTGTDRPPRGRVVTEGDHRIAMAFAVLGGVSGAAVEVDDLACADVSFPGFVQVLSRVRQVGG